MPATDALSLDIHTESGYGTRGTILVNLGVLYGLDVPVHSNRLKSIFLPVCLSLLSVDHMIFDRYMYSVARRKPHCLGTAHTFPYKMGKRGTILQFASTF